MQLAASSNSVKLVRLILKKGATVNAFASRIRGRTTLQAAIKSGSTDLVEILIDAGSDLNAAASPNSGYTALQAAVKINNVKLVSKLISLGVDINTGPSLINGRTCLQEAARKGHSELVQILLNAGAKVNATGVAKYIFTALQAVARAGNLSVVKVLLAAGADVHALATEGGYSAISTAIIRNSLEMVRLFLKTAGLHSNADPLPPIFRASRKGTTEIVQCLIRAGANINALRTDKPSWGYGYPCTALEAALCRGHYHVFEMLLNTSTDFNGQVPSLRAAVGAASTAWTYNLGLTEWDIVHKLLNAGADVNRAFSGDGMLLHNAVYGCRFDKHLVQMLLDAGAGVNGRTPDGNTALRNAVLGGNINLIEAPLNVGADIEAYAPTDAGRTTLQDAAQSGNTIVVRFILERGVNCNESAADSRGNYTTSGCDWGKPSNYFDVAEGWGRYKCPSSQN